MAKKKKKSKKVLKIVMISIVLVAFIAGGVFFVTQSKNNKKKEENASSTNKKKEEKPKVEEKKLKTVNPDSNSRNIAVMYNNISTVWGYQSGLQDAYLVYEILVEGGYTRLMAVFKDATTERIGSVRSSRPYFLDYALENDALYVHFGASEQALSDIKTLGVNNINGMSYSASFWRDKSLKLATEHTAFTSMEHIKKGIDKYKYRTTTKIDLLLDYSVDEIDISKMDGAVAANKVFIDYSASRSTTFEYDTVNKVYLRSQATAKVNYSHVDAITKKQYTAKNIITYQLPSRTIDSKGRQEINTTGGGKGYYITNGYAVPITWEKTSRASQTKYRYLDGTEIKVNDGNTYIEIQPSNKKLTIE